MKFYQYWILVIALILVVLTIINITKMVFMITKNSQSSIIKKDKELSANMRNLLLSICLLSITSFIYILLVFMD